MNIALIGADGQLGTDLAEVLSAEALCPLYYPEVDVTKPIPTWSSILRLSTVWMSARTGAKRPSGSMPSP
jgi:dTDP-4-dehydrorhamnose reductase